MPSIRRAVILPTIAAAVAATTMAATPLEAGARPSDATHSPSGAVYVLSNQVGGNAVLVYARSSDGTLTLSTSYPTGGTGTGAGLGSQGAIALDDSGRHLYAVNAGSGTISAFRVGRHGLSLVDVVPSGGTTPISLTVHGGLVYALNAGGSGNIAGFTVHDGDLTALPGSARPLSGSATMPAQVSFTPNGRGLVVTEKGTNTLDLFRVREDGRASAPESFPSAGTTPFGFAFDGQGHAIVSEAYGGAAGASAVSSYDVRRRAGISVISGSVPTGETAACWIAVTGDGRFAYAGNAGTNSVTGYAVSHSGALTRLGSSGKTGTAPAGVTDLALDRTSRFLVGRISNGSVGTWTVGRDGSLSNARFVSGLPAGAVGIAAE